jgi:phosphomannomutase
LRKEPLTKDAVFTDSGHFVAGFSPKLPPLNEQAETSYAKRYLDFFSAGSLQGLRVVVYQHSSVSRESLAEILERLGAEVVRAGRSDSFVPVDTEAVEDIPKLANWVTQYDADALASTDGDGDRPLLIDEKGNQVRGDLLGILVAEFLRADSVSVPVSCNSGVEKSEYFQHVSRTRIGSPFVISSMKKALQQGYRAVVGYEANGGFLTASDINSRDTGNVLRALPTRDAALPILGALRRQSLTGKSLSEQLLELPSTFTYSGLIRRFPNELGHSIVAALEEGGLTLAAQYFQETFGPPEEMDLTDGARITFSSGEIVHLRPSGNAPEFRCYTEAGGEDVALANNRKALKIIEDVIRPSFEKNSRRNEDYENG